MGALRPNPHRFKRLHTYTIDEIARLAPAHKNTVRRWLHNGLTAIDDKRPTLVRGQTLFDFLQERRQQSKNPCPPGFLYCLPCREPKEPADRKVELITSHPSSGNLRGRCPDCGRLIHRRVSLAKLAAIRGDLEITTTEASPRIGETSDISVNGDSSRMTATMPTHNPENERTKRRYITWLKETQGFSEPSLDQVLKAISRYELYTKFRDFRSFHIEQVKGFKRHLVEQKSQRSGQPLSHATVYSTLSALKAFFMWLAGQPGFKSGFSFGDWEYFSPSGITASVAKAHRSTRAPTLQQIRKVLESMPGRTDLERRDRALIAFIIVTGARDRAVASFRLRHIDIERRVVFQDAREVKTKFRKTFETWFFPVGDDIEQIVVEYVAHLVEEKLWGLEDPLFPATLVIRGSSGLFEPAGFDRKPWSDAGPIREIFNRAFVGADLPYANPHSFRNTLAALGRDKCKTLAEMQAWAQNLGHESLATTFGSYGKVAPYEQGELVRNVGRAEPTADKIDALMEMVARLSLLGPAPLKAED